MELHYDSKETKSFKKLKEMQKKFRDTCFVVVVNLFDQPSKIEYYKRRPLIT